MGDVAKINFNHHTAEWVNDPYSTYKVMREKCPVSYSEAHDGFWLLSHYKDVRKALLDWQTFTSNVPGTVAIPHSQSMREFRMIPLEADPPDHTQYRTPLALLFSRLAVDKLEPAVQAAANNIIDTFIDKGACELIHDYAEPLVSNALAIFLKLPLSDADLWIKWANAIFANRALDPVGAVRANAELAQYVDDLMAERRQKPRDDIFSAITQVEVDGRPLTDMELRGYGMEVLLAGREATIDGISNSLWYLAHHPEDRQRLINEPTLIRSAVEEFLRFISPIQLLGRIATRDVEIHGQLIRKGDAVAMTYGCANRDENAFSQADKCILDRKPNPHLAFGAGPHACIGAHLARLDMRVGISELLRRIPHYQLSESKPPEWKLNGDARGFVHLHVKFGGDSDNV